MVKKGLETKLETTAAGKAQTWQQQHCLALSLSRPVYLSGSRHHLAQCCFHSDGHHLWFGWDSGIPHCVGCDPRSALTSHVRHQCHLRSELIKVMKICIDMVIFE